jgi:hypothetical protein
MKRKIRSSVGQKKHKRFFKAPTENLVGALHVSYVAATTGPKLELPHASDIQMVTGETVDRTEISRAASQDTGDGSSIVSGNAVTPKPDSDPAVATAIAANPTEANQTEINVGIHSVDFASAVFITNNIASGGSMSFLDRGGETTSDMITLVRDAVSSTPVSLLSGMISTMSPPQTAPSPQFRSEAAPLPTTVAAQSVIQPATQPPPKHPRAPRQAFERGESVVGESRLFGTVVRDIGRVLLIALKGASTGNQSGKPAMTVVGWKPPARRLTRPNMWSGPPMAFARYNRPHGPQVSQFNGETERRDHFPVTEITPLP